MEPALTGAVYGALTKHTIKTYETFSKSWKRSLGYFARSRKSAFAGPSGFLRPCSQFCRVLILIPIRSANCFWDNPKYFLNVAKSPVSHLPDISRKRCFRVIARLKSLEVKSCNESVIYFQDQIIREVKKFGSFLQGDSMFLMLSWFFDESHWNSIQYYTPMAYTCQVISTEKKAVTAYAIWGFPED